MQISIGHKTLHFTSQLQHLLLVALIGLGGRKWR